MEPPPKKPGWSQNGPLKKNPSHPQLLLNESPNPRVLFLADLVGAGDAARARVEAQEARGAKQTLGVWASVCVSFVVFVF